MKIKKLLTSLGPAKSGTSWFVNYNFRRPLPSWRQIHPELRRQLEVFRDNSANRSPSQIVVDGWLEVDLHRASDAHPTFFLLGSSCDEDTGGFTFEQTQKNLRLCIQEKTRKIARVRHKYPEWWLVLVDRIGYGVDACDREPFREHLKVKHDWDKVIILSPLDPGSAFEVSSDGQIPPSGAKI